MQSGLDNTLHDNVAPVTIIYKWKCAARVVAIFDLAVEFIIFLIFVAILLLRAIKGTNIFAFSWIELAVGACSLIFTTWVTYLLLEATISEINVKFALKRVNLWMTVSILLLIVALVQRIVDGQVTGYVITFVVRGAFIVVVGEYCAELREAAAAEELLSNFA